MSQTPYLSDIKDLMHNTHFIENRKNVNISVKLGNPNINVLRVPHSKSVCSIVYRAIGDKQIYLARSDFIDKIGGQLYKEKQENKILAKCLMQTMAHQEKPYSDESL